MQRLPIGLTTLLLVVWTESPPAARTVCRWPLDRTVTWKAGRDVSRLAGKPVRLRFVLRDADLYALQFRSP